MIINKLQSDKRKLQMTRFAIQILSLILFIAFSVTYKQYAFLAAVPVMLILGPVFCGWLCPFGSIQRIIGIVGKKILGKRYNSFISQKNHNDIKYIRYIVAAIIIGIPIAARQGFVSTNIIQYFASIVTYLLLGGIALSLISERFYCKYLCKDGAIYSLSNLIKIKKIRRNSSSCVSCSKCDKACPMGIEISNKKVVKDIDCIGCYNCLSSCPIDNTLGINKNITPKSFKDAV